MKRREENKPRLLLPYSLPLLFHSLLSSQSPLLLHTPAMFPLLLEYSRCSVEEFESTTPTPYPILPPLLALSSTRSWHSLILPRESWEYECGTFPVHDYPCRHLVIQRLSYFRCNKSSSFHMIFLPFPLRLSEQSISGVFQEKGDKKRILSNEHLSLWPQTGYIDTIGQRF